jgi:hypothetical protein
MLLKIPQLKKLNFWTCTFMDYVASGTVCASSNIVVLITMERFFAVFYPLRHIQVKIG